MAKDVDPKKLTGRFSIDPNVKTAIVEIYCEDCLGKERVVGYEDHLEKHNFSRKHYECDNCGKIVCKLCAIAHPNCHTCDMGLLVEVTPKSGHDFVKALREL